MSNINLDDVSVVAFFDCDITLVALLQNRYLKRLESSTDVSIYLFVEKSYRERRCITSNGMTHIINVQKYSVVIIESLRALEKTDISKILEKIGM